MLFFRPDPPAERRKPADLAGNPQKLAEDEALCNEIRKDTQKTTTTASKSTEACRNHGLVQENRKKLAEGGHSCKTIPKNLQRS
jgi:hypothetical protein